MFAVLRVKVWPRVFVEEHSDHDAEKPADLRHPAKLRLDCLITVTTRVRVVFRCEDALVETLRCPIHSVRPDDRKALLFVTGYIIEKSLSIDNMFIFLLIFSSLAIPHMYQHKVLTVGILSAILMRIALILAGVSLLENFHFAIYVFGGLLLFTAIRMLIQMRKRDEKIEIEKNIAVRLMKKIVPVSFQLNGDKFFVRKDGILYVTSMMIALVIVEMTDLVFALDSIPAILAITSDSFIVITSNIFAILGLRSLYFLLAGMMSKFHYLKYGLIAILLFVGVKMSLTGFLEFPITLSVIVIFGILTFTLGLSFIKTRRILKQTI